MSDLLARAKQATGLEKKPSKNAQLLARVQKAREQATAEFVKDVAIHEMSVLVKSVYPELLDIAIREAKKDNTSIKAKMNMLATLLFTERAFLMGKALRDGLPVREHNSLIDDAARLSENILSNPANASRFRRVVNHVVAFSKLIEETSLAKTRESKEAHERLMRVMKHFYSIVPESLDRGESMYQRERRGFKPEALVLQGGGAKGMSYAGVAEIFHRTGAMDNIKYVAGTSAGGLLGVLIALGLKPDQINEIVKQGQFAQFFSESTGFFRALTMPGLIWDRFTKGVKPEDTPYLEGFNLNEFAENFMVPTLATHLQVDKSALLSMTDVELDELLLQNGVRLHDIYVFAMHSYDRMLEKNNRENEIGVLKFAPLLDRPEALQACVNAVRALRAEKHPESDLIESYIGDVIESTVSRYVRENPHLPSAQRLGSREKIRTMNFADLKELAIETNHKQFKEFGVAVTRSHSWSMTAFPRAFSKIAQKLHLKDKDPDKGFGLEDRNIIYEPVFVRAGEGYTDMPLKKAVRTSMNLPGVFKSIKHEGGKYIDGGMNANYPYRMFLDMYGDDVQMAEEKTCGFILSTIDSDMENTAIEQMAKVARDHLAVEIEKHDEGTLQALLSGSHELKDFFTSLGVDIATLNVGGLATRARKAGEVALGVGDSIVDINGKVLDKVAGILTVDINAQHLKNGAVIVGNGIKDVIMTALKYGVGKPIGWFADKMMDYNNVSLPTAQILDNTGVINSGLINTADFHIKAEQKQELIFAGERAAIGLLSGQADRQMRFSLGRLYSLLSIEKALCAKEGIELPIHLPPGALHRPEAVMYALQKAMNAEIKLEDALAGTLPPIHKKKIDETDRSSDHNRLAM